MALLLQKDIYIYIYVSLRIVSEKTQKNKIYYKQEEARLFIEHPLLLSTTIL